MMQAIQIIFIGLFVSCIAGNVFAADDEFVPAYQNEGKYQLEDPDKYNVDNSKKYIVQEGGRNYYTSGKKNGFRVNENDEESTDLTIGILTFPIVPATFVYMNLIGWWD